MNLVIRLLVGSFVGLIANLTLHDLTARTGFPLLAGHASGVVAAWPVFEMNIHSGDNHTQAYVNTYVSVGAGVTLGLLIRGIKEG